MRCQDCRDLISADLDGEAADDERVAVADHLDTCADCRAFQLHASGLHRALRLHDPGPVPDLSVAIVETHLGRAGAAVPPSEPEAARTPTPTRPASEPVGSRTAADRRHERRLGWARYGLLVVGLTQLVLSVPELVSMHGTDGIHTLHDLGTWTVAFSVGLLVVAWQPDRARGLFPMAVAFTAIMLLMVGSDLLAGRVDRLSEAPHVLELAGALLVGVTAHLEGGRGPGAPATRPRPSLPSRSGAGLALR